MPILARESEPVPVDPAPYRRILERFDPVKANGRVATVIGPVIESIGPSAMVGEVCEIRFGRSKPPVPAEVVGFRDNRVLLMSLGPMDGVRAGAEVVSTRSALRVGGGQELLGRVLDGLGRPLDGRGPIVPATTYEVNAAPPPSAPVSAQLVRIP